MIEINIPDKAALNLLRDQVNLEFKRQKRIGLVEAHILLENLSGGKIKEIVEIALFDIVSLLPVTLITEESNLPQIIYKTVRTLSTEFGDKVLSNYGENEAKSILLQIKKFFSDFSDTTIFQNN